MEKIKNKGHENLVPTNRRSKEEARALGAKGGKASGESRRKKRLLADICNMLGGMKSESPLVADLPKNEQVRDVAVAAAMYFAAENGDTKAATWIRDTKGESQIKVELEKAQPIDMSKLGFDE